jgi:rhodanese-related sulfurtransferase
VKGDYERPARTLAVFSGRDDVRKELRDTLRIWVADLRELGARAPIEGLEAARALVIDAEAKLGERDERALAVRYQTASGALQRYVASLPAEDPRAAEAYYWLGLIESRIGRSFWISQTEPYLEAVIRLAPGTPLARDAYALLEEFVVGAYTGSGGENVPDDVRAHLDALAHRIAAASAASEIERDELAGRVARGIAPLILDVRTPAEYARSHVPGARNIPHDQLAEQLEALAEHREREIVVYCESGRRAAHAIETLEDAGFRGVRHLEGDMAGWRKAGLPTE